MAAIDTPIVGLLRRLPVQLKLLRSNWEVGKLVEGEKREVSALVLFGSKEEAGFYSRDEELRAWRGRMLRMALQWLLGMGEGMGRFVKVRRSSWDPWNSERRTGWLG